MPIDFVTTESAATAAQLVRLAIHTGWHDDAAVVMLGFTAALFTVAGVARFARWRLVRDPSSALLATALILLGAVALPLVGIGTITVAAHHRPMSVAIVRAFATFACVGLIIRALRITELRPAHRPGRLLPLLSATLVAVFVGATMLDSSLPHPLAPEDTIIRVLSAGMVLGWLSVAVAVLVRGADRQWSRRSAPLFCGMAVAEALYGRLPDGPVTVVASLVVSTAVAALVARGACLELSASLDRAEWTMGSLTRALYATRGQATELTEWRASLIHDADNAVAGLRAALAVLDARLGEADVRTAALYRAAAAEVQHLDHLLHREPTAPCRSFDVGAVVEAVGRTAEALGSDVTSRVHARHALGRPDDLVAVLKNLLANARRHAPGARVLLAVEHGDREVRIVCEDDGPGLDPEVARHAFDRGFRGPASAGSGLGLHDARSLMRAQGGDLVLEQGTGGARFVALLAAPQESVARIPRQRDGIPVTTPEGVGSQP